MNSFKLLTQYKDYRYFWCSNFMSNFGVWIQVVASGIYMSELSQSPLQIALVQVMSTLPIFIFSIPLGVLADTMNIYRLLSTIQITMAVTMLVYSLLCYNNVITAEWILLFTGLIAVATAIRLPTGQSAISQTVPHENIKIAAITNNFGYSLARAAGPFIAGTLFFYLRPYNVFGMATVLFFLPSLYFLSKASRTGQTNCARKNYLQELAHGFKYAKSSSYFKIISTLSFIFFFLSTGLWSVMPYLAKYIYHYDAKMQGAMTGMIGLGSILTGFIFPSIRNKCSSPQILLLLFFLSGTSIIGLLFTNNLIMLFLFLIIFGFSWACAVSFFNGEIQSLSPIELRSRLISIYFFVMYGGMALGGYALGKGLLYFSLKHLFVLEGLILIINGIIIFLLTSRNKMKEIRSTSKT